MWLGDWEGGELVMGKVIVARFRGGPRYGTTGAETDLEGCCAIAGW